MAQTMQALVWHGTGDLRIEEVPVPRIGAKDVLVKVRYAGICATDQEIFNGHYPYPAPYIPGHEITGTIEEIGEDVESLRVGDRVVIDPAIPCETCGFCRSGRSEFCLHYRELGINANGGWAQYVQAPARCVYPIPDSVGDKAAAVIEPLVCPLGAVHAAGVEAGDHVLVLGDGPAAMYFVQIARMMGAASVSVSYKLDSRTDKLRTYGATRLVESKRIHELTDTKTYRAHGGFDLVIDAVGYSETVKQAVELVRVGGRIVLYGLKEAETKSFPHKEIVLKNLTLYGRTNAPTLWGKAIESIENGFLQIDSIPDLVVGPHEVADILAKPHWPWVKCIVKWSE
ncbi:zinc-dependent alcohol dehydrogenase [Paenibacillus flagellatus]|uniref:Zinc-binding dehydrogenase n=1 Tax=Paenibacillus flagellatus TaxID=2211139 RepID=A0A2V5JXB6_9BACL|nr:alcohol dehydrogenase catalytic domain-containing protein [Paenibacillus flagellatus]PYI51291.1 zinc-binding dehydrogenase [Paenibacillus flagellatus]